MDYTSFTLESLPAYLVEKIPEISFLLSTMLMFFIGDYMMEVIFKKALRKMTFIARTVLFLMYGLVLLPVLSTACAIFLQDSVLYPYKQWIIPLILASFVFIGILLSIRYNMDFKIRLK